jgi:RND family efflux transporter MFP subunit
MKITKILHADLYVEWLKSACFLYFLILFSFAYAEETAITRVTVKPLSDLVSAVSNSTPANVVSLNYATLSAQISGKANTLHFNTGDPVKQGDVLVEMDCRDYRYALQQAKAGFAAAKAQRQFAEKQYLRNQQLRKSRTISQDLLDRAILDRATSMADIEAKQALLKKAELAVERCKIKAPYDGQVTAKFISQGQLLAPDIPILKLMQTNNLEIQAELTAREVVDVKKSSRILFVSGDDSIPVQLRAIVREIKENTRTQEVRLKPGNVSDLSSGQSGRLVWKAKHLLLPAQYLSRRNGELGVLLAKDNKAIFHKLPDAQEGQPAKIDLPDSTLVIDTNRFRLRVNETIKIEKTDEK